MRNAHLAWAESLQHWRHSWMEQQMPTGPEFQTIEAQASDAWESWSHGAKTEPPVIDWPASLRVEPFVTLCAKVEASLVGDEQRADEAGAAPWLAGRAVGRALAGAPPDWGRFEQDFMSRPYWFAVGFRSAFIAALDRDSAQRERWAEVIGSKTLSLGPTSDPTSKRIIEEVRAKWQRCRNPLAAWHEHSFDDNRFPKLGIGREYRFLDLLRRLDPERWFRALRVLPIPQMIDAAVTSEAVIEDGDELIKLIERAPLVGSGMSPPSVALLYLLDGVERHLVRTRDELAGITRGLSEFAVEASNRLEALERHEQPEWLRRCYSALLDREDGPEVAWRFGARLIRRQLRGAAERVPAAVFDLMLNELIECLAQRKNKAAVGRHLWESDVTEAVTYDTEWPMEREPDGGDTVEGAGSLRTIGLPLLLLAVEVAEQVQGHVPGSMGMDDHAQLSGWMQQIIQGREPGLQLLDLELVRSHQASYLSHQQWAMNKLAAVLIAGGEPLRDLRALLRLLAPQERQALYYLEAGRSAESNVSRITLLLAAQFGAALMARYHGQRTSGQEVFLFAQDRLLLQYLSSSAALWRREFRELRMSMVQGTLLIPQVFGADWPEAIDPLLHALHEDTWIMHQLLTHLPENGISREDLIGRLTHLKLAWDEGAEELRRWYPNESFG